MKQHVGAELGHDCIIESAASVHMISADANVVATTEQRSSDITAASRRPVEGDAANVPGCRGQTLESDDISKVTVVNRDGKGGKELTKTVKKEVIGGCKR
jgi:acetaldehyde dehydrogenase (acetylating)